MKIKNKILSAVLSAAVLIGTVGQIDTFYAESELKTHQFFIGTEIEQISEDTASDKIIIIEDANDNVTTDENTSESDEQITSSATTTISKDDVDEEIIFISSDTVSSSNTDDSSSYESASVSTLTSTILTDSTGVEYELYTIATDYDTINERLYWSEFDAYKSYYKLALSAISENTINVNDIDTLLNYMAAKFMLYDPNSTVTASWYGTSLSVDCEETTSTRAQTIAAIINKFGTEQVSSSDDIEQAVINACQRIYNGLNYNLNYMYMDTITALNNSQGVCAHFAASLAVILNAEGIPCRIVCGYINGQAHAWNEVYIDGSWVTVDCTVSSTGFGTDKLYTYSKFM